MPIIEVKHLKKFYKVVQKKPGLSGTIKSLFNRKYKEIKAVNDISLNIQEQELVGFIGPNGAGKTTTLKVLSGLLYPTSGQVSVAGYIPWERKSGFQKQFAFVAGQRNQLWWDLPAVETFHLNKEIYEIKDDLFKKRLANLTKMLSIEDLLNTPVKKLSLGQRMKAELVAALIHEPKILFLDEPTIGLDVVARNNMHEFIKNYNQNFGATIVLTSHYMEDVQRLASRVIIINLGQIIFNGKLSALVDKYATHKAISINSAKELPKLKLQTLGKIIEFDTHTAKIEVPKKEVTVKTQQLLKNFPIIDLTVEEPPIEEIIRQIFESNK